MRLPLRARCSLHAGPAAPDVRRGVFAIPMLLAAVLAACGGGGGSGTPDASGGPAVDPTPTLQLKGVAATGAALAGAAVSATCATGSGTATAGTDGTFTVAVANGALPCALEASSGTTTLHSVAAGTGGGTATANVTPLTELLVAHLTGQDPKAFFASLSSGSATLTSSVTTDAVGTAGVAVIAALKDAGVDTAPLKDLLAGELKAGTGSGYDGVLDTLKTTLTRTGSTLATLATAVASASPAAAAAAAGSPAAGSEAASSGMLPAALLLRSPAADCASLRSGKYRFIVVRPSAATGPTDPVTAIELATLDAAAAAGPTWTWEDGTSDTMAPVAGQACHYQAGAGASGTFDALVAPSGIVFARSTQTGDASQRLVIALPEQTLPLSSLAGTWSALAWTPTAGVWGPDAPIVTIAADGKITIACADTAPSLAAAGCAAPLGPFTGITLNPAGGADVTVGPPGAEAKARAFAFQGGNGMKTLLLIEADGTLTIMTPQREATLPAVGEAWNAWNILLNPQAVASDALQYNGFAVTATDPSARSMTRTVTNKATGVSHPQTLIGGRARTGWAYRAGTTATGSDGSAVTVREMYALRTGLGFTAYWLPSTNGGSNARFGLSVNQP